MSESKADASSSSTENVTADAKYDLSTQIIPYLDRHLVVPILDFLIENKLYKVNDLRKAKFDIMAQTKMIDSASEELKGLTESGVNVGRNPEEIEGEFSTRRNAVLAEIEAAKVACGPILQLLRQPNGEEADNPAATLASDLASRQNLNLEFISQRYDVTPAHVEQLYNYARLYFDIGFYNEASIALYVYKHLTDDDDKLLQAEWGQLAADILLAKSSSSDCLRELRLSLDPSHRNKAIDARQASQRVWLAHWALFMCRIGSPACRSEFIETFTDLRTMMLIQSSAPHLLRYVVVAYVVSPLPRSRPVLKDLLRALTAEAERYSDPVTKLFSAMLVDFDFVTASKLLKEVRVVFASDIFLQHTQLRDDFINAARAIFCDMYARLHKGLDVAELRDMLGVVDSDIEKLTDKTTAHFAGDDEGEETKPALITAPSTSSTPAPSSSTSSSSSSSSTGLPWAGASGYSSRSTKTLHQHIRDRTRAIAIKSQQLTQLIDKRAQSTGKDAVSA